MIDYTRAALAKTVDDIKKFGFVFNLGSNCLYIIYLIYAMLVGAGNIYANIILCTVTLAYTVFYLFTRGGSIKRRAKQNVSSAYRWFKIAVSGFMLGVTVYGIYIAADHISVVSIVMAAITAICWTLQVIIALVIYFVESRVNFIVAAMEADFEKFTKPVEKVTGFIKKITGQEVEEKEKKPGRMRRLLDKTVTEFRAEKARKKAAKKEEKLRKKQEAAEARRAREASSDASEESEKEKAAK